MADNRKEKKLRVLQIIPGFPTGGAEQVVLSYLRYFIDNKDVEMHCLSLSPYKGRLYEKQISEEGLSVAFFNGVKKSKLLTRIEQIRFIRKNVKLFHADVVHIHLSILWVVTVALIGNNAKRFHTLHNDPRELTKGKGILISKFCYKYANVQPIALNYEFKIVAEALYGKKCEVLANGIQLEKFSNVSKVAARKKLNIDNGTFVVGHVGRFHKQKNHEKIIDVFKCIKDKREESILLLVGDGELKNKIYQKVKKLKLERSVFFLGNRSDIPEIMASMDVFLFPSLYEGLGIVLVEAQAAGLKCVISNNVPRETIVTNRIVSLPLEEADSVWANAVINESSCNLEPSDTLDSFSISSICNKLLRIYSLE